MANDISLAWRYCLFFWCTVVRIDQAKHVLTIICDEVVTLKLKDCNFFPETIYCLNYVARLCHLQIASNTTDAIKILTALRNISELKLFLSFCNVLERFVSNFPGVASLFDNYLRKGQPLNWKLNEIDIDAIKNLQEKLILPPVLALPFTGELVRLATGACGVYVGCIVMQEQPDRTTKPIGYQSSSVTSAKRTYDTRQLKCLSIAWEVVILGQYFEDTRFTIRTDLSSLMRIRNLSCAFRTLLRWRLRLFKFYFDIGRRARVELHAANTL